MYTWKSYLENIKKYSRNIHNLYQVKKQKTIISYDDQVYTMRDGDQRRQQLSLINYDCEIHYLFCTAFMYAHKCYLRRLNHRKLSNSENNHQQPILVRPPSSMLSSEQSVIGYHHLVINKFQPCQTNTANYRSPRLQPPRLIADIVI